MREDVWIIERGQGFPDAGELVSEDDAVYRILEYKGQIDTRSRQGNRKRAVIEHIGNPFDVTEQEWKSMVPVKIQRRQG